MRMVHRSSRFNNAIKSIRLGSTFSAIFCWGNRLLQYAFNVVYQPGHQNKLAGYLSRITIEDSYDDENDDATILKIFETSCFCN